MKYQRCTHSIEIEPKLLLQEDIFSFFILLKQIFCVDGSTNCLKTCKRKSHLTIFILPEFIDAMAARQIAIKGTTSIPVSSLSTKSGILASIMDIIIRKTPINWPVVRGRFNKNYKKKLQFRKNN